jgi:hypothetical protein
LDNYVKDLTIEKYLFNPSRKQEIFLFSKTSRPHLVSTTPSVLQNLKTTSGVHHTFCSPKPQDHVWPPSSVVKVAGREADHSLPSTADSKNAWHCTFSSPYAFKLCTTTTLSSFLCEVVRWIHQLTTQKNGECNEKINEASR